MSNFSFIFNELCYETILKEVNFRLSNNDILIVNEKQKKLTGRLYFKLSSFSIESFYSTQNNIIQ
jgi:hypothetical protein